MDIIHPGGYDLDTKWIISGYISRYLMDTWIQSGYRGLTKYPWILSIKYPSCIQSISTHIQILSMDTHLRIQISIGYFFEYPWIISGYEWIYIHGYEGAYPLHYFGYFMDILWIYIHGYGGAYPLHYYGYNVNFTGIFRHTEGDLRR